MNSQKTYTLSEATKKIKRYCAYQERCHKEVKDKLREMRMIPDAIDQIMGLLITENYLNEERFAKVYTRGKFRVKHWGKQRIISALKARHISEFNIKIALREIEEEDYQKTLDQLARKRIIQIKDRNLQKRRKKLADYLLYRGWESHLVYQKVRELIAE